MERLARDVLRPGEVVQVRRLDRVRLGGAAARGPHRHDYHEIVWVRDGRGHQLVDGERVPVVPGTLTVVGRGQVHVFAEAEDLTGAVIRLGDAMLAGDGGRIVPGWLLPAPGGVTVHVPPSERDRLEGVVAALEGETRHPPDPYTDDVARALVTVLLLWAERWHDAMRTEDRAGDVERQLHRRFARLLESDFARHHDAAHYAEALGVPPAALSRALTAATGRPTKHLVTDRVMAEAARLLRFTDLTVGEVAHAVGYRDPLYFSRAFARHRGIAPQAYRDGGRGA